MMEIQIGGQGGNYPGSSIKDSKTGVGNPGSNNGTGGLLTIFANKIKNEGNIVSNGVGSVYRDDTAGSSGGGSINIFYNGSYENHGTILVQKGITPKGRLLTGGSGGDGSISIGQLINGTYTSTYTNY